MLRYRSRTDIVAEILEATRSGGMPKSKIMYKTLLSYRLVDNYLAISLENGLLEYDAKDRVFKATEKGMRFLSVYSMLSEYMANPLKT
jgi:predicted transcriptional regulator